MTDEDNADLQKRAAHLDYILTLATVYDLIRRRKRKTTNLDIEITHLENHIAAELTEFLNNG